MPLVERLADSLRIEPRSKRTDEVVDTVRQDSRPDAPRNKNREAQVQTDEERPETLEHI